MADVTFEKFGGLNLVSDPQEAGAQQALSCLNVSLDRNGRLRSRDGYDVVYGSGAAAALATSIHPVSGTTVLVSFAGNSVKAVDVDAGTSSASAALNAGTIASSFASTGSSAVYFTDSSSTQIRKFSGGAFSSPAGLASYEANYLEVQPLDDRLVIADANNTSRLWFSDPAAPETITYSAGPPETGNFLELTPGDGERITGMCVFGTELFVFKQTKFFVFSGNTGDGIGGVIFNYRMVDMGVGIPTSHSALSTVGAKLTAVHETGVYFVGADGIYRTAGGAPVKVSKDIDPVFPGMNMPIPAPFSSVITTAVEGFYNLSVTSDKLYAFAVATTTPAVTYVQFVMDLRTGEWVVSDMSAGAVLDGDVAGMPGTAIFGVLASGNGAVATSTKDDTSDDGAAISWHHHSGWYDLGSQNSKRTRQTVLWGQGSPTLSVFTDHGTSDANAAAVTLGGVLAPARGWHRKAYRGVLFAHRLSGTAAATIHRIGHTVADERTGR